jgi:hypothetical protein
MSQCIVKCLLLLKNIKIIVWADEKTCRLSQNSMIKLKQNQIFV